MGWYAGGLENAALYTFSVANTAIGKCKNSAGGGEGLGEIISKPSSFALARCRLNDPVPLGEALTKRARFEMNVDNSEWGATTQALAKTLDAASMVLIEGENGWKAVSKYG